MKPSTIDRAGIDEIVDAAYNLRASGVKGTARDVTVQLDGGVLVTIPIIALGEPWSKANGRQLSRVRLRMGGSWLWWDDLDEGLVLDEMLPRLLKLNPATLLARRSRGRKASLAKAAAARKNGIKGGRPRRREQPRA